MMTRSNPAQPSNTEPMLFVATASDGSQTLVTIWGPEDATMATRPDPYATWGIPVPLEVAP